jgi:predicted Abi (CAAX) family protease
MTDWRGCCRHEKLAVMRQREGEGKSAAADRLPRRLRTAFRTLPDRSGWQFAACQALWLLPLIGLLGWRGGFLAWHPTFETRTWMLLAVAFVFPAVVEEALFRVSLVPLSGTPGRRRAAACVALILFVLWHPIQSRLYSVPWHALALSPWFLASVAALGAACTRIWLRTRSIWPCVAMHWSVVAAWKALFGAPLVLAHP